MLIPGGFQRTEREDEEWGMRMGDIGKRTKERRRKRKKRRRGGYQRRGKRRKRRRIS